MCINFQELLIEYKVIVTMSKMTVTGKTPINYVRAKVIEEPLELDNPVHIALWIHLKKYLRISPQGPQNNAPGPNFKTKCSTE